MAIKFLLVALFFALVVIKPVHDTHKEKPLPDDDDDKHDKHRRDTSTTWTTMATDYEYYSDYLWMYLVFAYIFTAWLLYLIVAETRRIVEIRQRYLGSQTTITDRTVRLSGIPLELRSENKIKEFIEDLEIGKVESVTLCKNWKELDDRLFRRDAVLRKLEESWTVYLGNRTIERSLETLPLVQPNPPAPVLEDGYTDQEEGSPLLHDTEHDPDGILPYSRQRPLAKIWHGRFKLQVKKVDAINYYEEKLRRLDEEIKLLRKKDFDPTPLAFVTMDSVASAQMAIQAVLSPSPLELLANSSPAATDIVWYNIPDITHLDIQY
jgi:calcium permeable stress-gated cation channel